VRLIYTSKRVRKKDQRRDALIGAVAIAGTVFFLSGLHLHAIFSRISPL
jgi:hypothetical protein